jgi:alkanesulfonate monooxygenase SsuD/methylene tetrahydromethanopterin reductase-like flavin-dependent oxidoreductase (luciferase family)
LRFSTFHSFAIHAAAGGVTDAELSSSYGGVNHTEAIRREIDRIKLADDLGVDTVWLREHHFSDYGFLSSPMVMAGHVAALTKRVRIGTAVVTLPLHHAIRAAEEAALVDVLSGGRLTYGIGRGYQSLEYNAFGLALDEARDRTDEAIEILRKLWTHERVTHKGRFFEFEDVRLQPKPVQAPHPPLIYASISPDSVAHYARKGIPFMVDSTLTFDQLEKLAAIWADAAEHRDGISELAGPVALRSVWIADSNEDAKAYIAGRPGVKSVAYQEGLGPVNKDGSIAKGYEYWRKGWHGRNLDHYNAGDWDSRWIAGDPQRVIDQILWMEELGYRDICISFGHMLEWEDERRHMERFARDIMPYCRASTGVKAAQPI